MEARTNGDRSHAQDGNARVKVPTVQQALPYTPFTSIIPFDTSIIATPKISGIHSQNIQALDKNRLQSSRDVLDKLSNGADRAELASAKCQKTIKDVKKMLQSNQLNLQFRKPIDRSGLAADNLKPRTPKKLSHFAQFVFDAVEFDSAEEEIVVEPKLAPPGVLNGTADHHAQGRQHPQSTATIDPASLITRTPSTLQRPLLQTAVPPLPSEPVQIHTNALQVDERAKGKASVAALSSLLQEIVEADDAITVGDQLGQSILTIFRFFDKEPLRLLSPAYQSRLEHAVSKCVSAGRLEAIATDDLKRAQKLCNDIILAAPEEGLQVQDEWSDSEIDQWLQNLGSAESALLAVRVLLKIMTGSSAEVELQSEDLVRSLLSVIRSVAETCIVSNAELHGQKKESASSKFSIAKDHHEQLLLILRGFTKAIRSLTALLAKVKVDETAISTIVYVCKIILFAENAPNDRDSVFGVQTFEASRRYSMDLMARIFDRYPEQRQFIFEEILLSLEKLPGTKQSARQYRIPDAKPIQLVSALIMQLIQTSATVGKTRTAMDNEDGSATEDADGSEDEDAAMDEQKPDTSKPLQAITGPLEKATQTNALYVTNILVQRALNTSKNADEPHRKLLDIFTDDFLAVLGLPEWPSAELLLRSLLRQMIAIVENRKSAVPARNFALESLGQLGAGILDLSARFRKRYENANHGDVSTVDSLHEVIEQLLDGLAPDATSMLNLAGPYRTLVEYLYRRTSDTTATTSLDYTLLQWAQQASTARELEGRSQLESSLQAMLTSKSWLDTHIVHDAVSVEDAKLAMMCIVMGSPFCKAVHKISNVLLSNVGSEHSTVKARSIKSVLTLVETDPALLDRNTLLLPSIMKCADDASSLVRDSALAAIARCTALRPQLETKVYEYYIRRLGDSAVTVKRRAIKMLKEIYLRNEVEVLRAAIATALVRKVSDTDESIVELVKQSIEDIWFQPFYTAARSTSTDSRESMAYQAHAILLVTVVEASDEVPDALVTILDDLLVEAKNATSNKAVIRYLVDALFNGLIGEIELPGNVTQAMILQALAVVAQASPKTLKASHLELLEPYTKNLATNEDLPVFRLALTILRHVMPHTSGLQRDFLNKLQMSLLASIGKLPSSEFSEVAICLWTIDGELKNTERLIKLTTQALIGISTLAKQDLSNAALANKLVRLISLSGQLGKACDFETHIEEIKSKVPGAKSKTVSGIIVESLAGFAKTGQALQIRQSALQAITAVCQRWPKEFLRPDVGMLFDSVLREQEKSLEEVFLAGLLEFFAAQEINTSATKDPEEGATGRERLAKTYVATDQDGATAALSQRYLQQILRLATSSTDDTALTATKLVASIVRQGLPHPKECGPSLIALETSPNVAIAKIACEQHRSLHEKHETIIEKEYMRAMERVLVYQQQVVSDIKGYTSGQPPVAKLCYFWDVLKVGKAKVRQKYLTNICGKLVFAVTKTDLAEHLVFVRFMVENLAFFDYDKLEDVRLLVENLGKSFATVGTSLAQRIESEVFNMTVESLSTMASQEAVGSGAPLTPESLATLSQSAQILLLIAETRAFLLRLWGGQKLLKRTSKDSKSLARSTHAPTLNDAYIKRMEELSQPVIDEMAQRAMCQTFSEVLSTDNEAKGDEDMDDDEKASEMTRSPSGTPSGRKRKLSIGNGPPKKRGRPRKTPSFNRYDDDDDAEGEWE